MSNLVFNTFLNSHEEIDLLAALLADKRSINTKHAYEKDLKDFFLTVSGQLPAQVVIAEFLKLSRFDAIALVLKYKSHLVAKGLKEATVNRRLSAIKALVNYAGKVGACNWNLNEIQGESVQAYRDTTGVSPEAIKDMLAIPDRKTLKGKRDYALLRLLWDNALRRNEVAAANISDFDPLGRSLQILGKGRGTQKSAISISKTTVDALQAWLAARKEQEGGIANGSSPLFIALDRSSWGHRLTGTAIYKIVDKVAKSAGIDKQMSPHRVRHSAITAALDATDGNVRKVQKLSRHKKLDTLMLYDDNRTNMQSEVSDLLSELI